MSKDKSLDYKLEINRIAEFYKRADKLPEMKTSYDQYIHLIVNDSDLSHYEKSELLLYWRDKIDDQLKQEDQR